LKLKNKEALLLLTPSILILLVTTVFPFLFCIWVSLNNIIIFYPVPNTFRGLQNYIDSLTNPIYGFWKSAYTTLIFTGSSILLEFILGLGIALLLNKEFKGVGFLRSIIVIPLLVSPVSIGLIFRLMFQSGNWSLVNYILKSIGMQPLNWLAEKSLAMLVLIITDTWQWTPLMVLIFLAGLRMLPQEPFDAASVDGASSWQIFRYLTVPMLKEMMAIAFLLRLMDSLKTFDIIYVVTLGGPGEATQNLNYNAFLQSFVFGNLSIAAAQILMLTVVVIIISSIILKMVRR
jgi:multiple sugar transport system permease protein